MNYMINVANEEKKFDFLILAPTFNAKQIQDTIKSLRIYYPENHFIISCSIHFDKEQVKWVKDLDHRNIVIKKGGTTICGLINAGEKEIKNEWFFVFVAGSRIKNKIDKKYFSFIKDKEIGYSVVERRMYFYEASLNGMLLSKTSFKDIGEFPDISPDISGCKSVWLGEGQEKGYKFKGLVCVPITG